MSLVILYLTRLQNCYQFICRHGKYIPRFLFGGRCFFFKPNDTGTSLFMVEGRLDTVSTVSGPIIPLGMGR